MAALIKGLVTLFALSVSFSAYAAKKTACTITINSKNEREIFRKNLPPGEWDIVELLPKEVKDKSEDEDDEDTIPSWLNNACAKGIQCDLLVVSGHFGGTFFGSSGYELSLEQLERAACRPECAGIVKKPKEVFLFGCNTLSGKEKDRRTPEEYLRVLIEDGMDRSRAEQTVALRYSPWGDANYDRMRAVFSESPKIYGFSSVGPLGNTTDPRLKRYFKNMKGSYASHIDGLTKESPPNMSFKKSFGDTTFMEGIGQRSKSTSAICYLENPKVPHSSKLNLVAHSLNGPKPLEHAPAIASWVKSVQDKEWTDQEGEIWDRITWNRTLRENFLSLASNIKHLPMIEISLWRFAMHMRWLKPAEFKQKQEEAVVPFFTDGKITVSERDALCGVVDVNSKESIAVDYQKYGMKNPDNFAVFALACLGNADATMARTAEAEIVSPDEEKRKQAVAALYLMHYRAGYTHFDRERIRKALDTEKNEGMRALLSMLLSASGALNEKDWLKLAEAAVAPEPDNAAFFYFAGGKNIPVSVLPVFYRALYEAKSSDELRQEGSRFLRALGLSMIVWRLAPAEAIVESLLPGENQPRFADVLAYFEHDPQIPKEKKNQVFVQLMEKAKEGMTKYYALVFLNRINSKN